jgi:hydroxymethylpyrimidine/phosphomethylpyrimidine kinase
VLSDIGADAIKTGMLGSASVIEAVSDELKERGGGIPLVVDPVMVAKGGAALIEDPAIEALRKKLLPLAFLLTPNIPEAERLTGIAPLNDDDALQAAEKLAALGVKHVLFKGGHAEGAHVRDRLIDCATGALTAFESARIETRHTHGTGCTLATAIACGLGAGKPLQSAVAEAHAFVHEAIRTAPGFGHGHGPLNHLSARKP